MKKGNGVKSMYGFLSKISQTITEPVTVLIDSFAQYPLVVALLLGLVGAVAPCQLTGNMSAITLYGSRTIQMKNDMGEIIAFMVGKIAVFSSLGFSLAFCPTMFVLFFFWLMPLVMSTSYGFVLPAVFGIATSLPLIILFLLLWIFDAKRLIMRRSMKVGRVVQRIAGVFLIIIGLVDTITYWDI